MDAQSAIRRGPEVYCFWTVPGQSVTLSLGSNQKKHTSNVTKLPILEDQKFPPFRDPYQSFHRSTPKVINDIGMRFEHTYTVTDIVG